MTARWRSRGTRDPTAAREICFATASRGRPPSAKAETLYHKFRSADGDLAKTSGRRPVRALSAGICLMALWYTSESEESDIHATVASILAARRRTVSSVGSHRDGSESFSHDCMVIALQNSLTRKRRAAGLMPISSANFRQWPESIELMESLPPIFIAGIVDRAGQQTVETRS